MASERRIFNQELKVRIISALLLAAIVLATTFVGGIAFKVLWAIAALLIFREFSRICGGNMPTPFPLLGALGILAFVAAWLAGHETVAIACLTIVSALLLIGELFIHRSIWTSLGVLYSGLPFAAMSQMRGAETQGLLLILILFAIVWGADILAYFFGKTIGGPKLAPRISPKKTWSGFIGSLLGAFLLTLAVETLFGYEMSLGLALLVLFLACVAQIGDLLESGLKRRFNVKDSGTLIPGHGGVLDRIDGLILAGVSLWVILLVYKYSERSQLTLAELFTQVFLLP